MLSDSKLINAIKGGESDSVEFTESVNKSDKIRKAICAFANDLSDSKSPGLVFVGIKDDGSCANIKVDDDLLKNLSGLRSDGKIHPFPVMEVKKCMLDGCEVAVIQAMPSDNPPVKVDGRCWISVGPTRRQASPEEEKRLMEKRKWGNLPHDMQGVKDATVEQDLDMQKFEREYLRYAVSREVLAGNNRDSGHQLKALRLTDRDGTPTATAILILGKEPAYWFPGAYVQFLRLSGTKLADEVQDSRQMYGTLTDQLLDIKKTLTANITVPVNTLGVRHVKQPNYPYRALRELVHNAVIHRDYGHESPVRINWFVDRIEIISPGRPYGNVTLTDSVVSTAYRNPTIAEAMNRLGYMERFGRGIAIARETLEENGNPPPVFEVVSNNVLVTIHKRQ